MILLNYFVFSYFYLNEIIFFVLLISDKLIVSSVIIGSLSFVRELERGFSIVSTIIVSLSTETIFLLIFFPSFISISTSLPIFFLYCSITTNGLDSPGELISIE